MARILRGDIFWADLQPARGHEQARLRPVVVISQNIFNELSGTVLAMAITSQPRNAGFPLTLELTDKKLPRQSWVKISQIRTVSTQRLGEKVGHIPREKLEQLIEGLNEIVGV
jgi:mRNA interferase MazF